MPDAQLTTGGGSHFVITPTWHPEGAIDKSWPNAAGLSPAEHSSESVTNRSEQRLPDANVYGDLSLPQQFFESQRNTHQPNRNRPSKSSRRVNRKESRYRGMSPKLNKLT